MVRRHPMPLAGDGLLLLAALVLQVAARHYLPAFGAVRFLLGTALLALVLRTGWRAAAWHADRFIVTDQRILLVTGLLTRRVAMLPLRKVTDMTYRRSPAGRLLGYGEFVMESAGESQALRRVRYLPHPDALYLQVARLLFSEGGTPAAVPEY